MGGCNFQYRHDRPVHAFFQRVAAKPSQVPSLPRFPAAETRCDVFPVNNTCLLGWSLVSAHPRPLFSVGCQFACWTALGAGYWRSRASFRSSCEGVVAMLKFIAVDRRREVCCSWARLRYGVESVSDAEHVCWTPRVCRPWPLLGFHNLSKCACISRAVYSVRAAEER